LPHDRNISIGDKSEITPHAPVIAALTEPGARSRLIDLRLEAFPRNINGYAEDPPIPLLLE
jgi:hypothetical protein